MMMMMRLAKDIQISVFIIDTYNFARVMMLVKKNVTIIIFSQFGMSCSYHPHPKLHKLGKTIRYWCGAPPSQPSHIFQIICFVMGTFGSFQRGGKEKKKFVLHNEGIWKKIVVNILN
jgi:hypothetical protein